MSRQLTWFDRLRIERAVWGLDQRLYDLPRAARIAHRRELRQNLASAASEVGTEDRPAQRRERRPARRGLPRCRVRRPPAPLVDGRGRVGPTSMLVVTSLLTEAANGFAAGVAATPHATGTFHWSGLFGLQNTVTCVAVDGHTNVTGGSLSLLGWGLWLAIGVLIGRLWRVPATRRARARAAVA